jgi:hypothetical protein
MVVVEESTDTFTPLNRGVRVRRRWRPLEQLVAESLVVSLAMIVLDVLLDDKA